MLFKNKKLQSWRGTWKLTRIRSRGANSRVTDLGREIINFAKTLSRQDAKYSGINIIHTRRSDYSESDISQLVSYLMAKGYYVEYYRDVEYNKLEYYGEVGINTNHCNVIKLPFSFELLDEQFYNTTPDEIKGYDQGYLIDRGPHYHTPEGMK